MDPSIKNVDHARQLNAEVRMVSDKGSVCKLDDLLLAHRKAEQVLEYMKQQLRDTEKMISHPDGDVLIEALHNFRVLCRVLEKRDDVDPETKAEIKEKYISSNVDLFRFLGPQ